MSADSFAASDALHARVQRFARQSIGEGVARDPGPEQDSFETLARDIAEFQARHVFGHAQSAARSVPSFAPYAPELHPVAVDAFRVREVFAFSPARASVRFVTSGTTGAQSGRHWMRNVETYRLLSELWGRRALCSAAVSAGTHVVALMPEPSAAPSSSLGFMAQHFMGVFEREQDPWRLIQSAERWLLTADGVDVAGLRRAAERAAAHDATLTLLATSFALVMLLDALAGDRLPLPLGSVVMLTGGYKGKTRVVPEDELRAGLLATFGDVALVGEYGMTELSSQLYDGVVPGAALRGPQGVFLPPPWLRVVPLAPETLTPVAAGSPGLAAFIDLGNVDSAVCVLTQDLVVTEGDGIRLLGRRPRAPLRGCSLAVEALYEGNAAAWMHVAKGSALATPKWSTPVLANRAAGFERVRRLRDVAQWIADPTSPLGQRARSMLPQATGLSAEAVELGLEALEANASDAELHAFCARAPAAARVWVVLSANVFVASYRAIAWALACSADVVVRPSRRDPVLAQLLHEAAPDLFRLGHDIEPRAGDHVYAYGSDETMSALADALPEGVRLWAHGSGLGAGLVLRRGQERQSAAGFARDAVLFEQRGCLSPRVIALSSECVLGEFTLALAEELTQWAARAPAPELSADERADRLWHANVSESVGEYRSLGAAGSITIQHDAVVPAVPPPGRNLVVCQSDDPIALIASLGNVLTCLGVDAESMSELIARFPGVRVVTPGKMQTPHFDGPVDLRAAT